LGSRRCSDSQEVVTRTSGWAYVVIIFLLAFSYRHEKTCLGINFADKRKARASKLTSGRVFVKLNSVLYPYAGGSVLLQQAASVEQVHIQ
jgi:hypothetical protein